MSYLVFEKARLAMRCLLVVVVITLAGCVAWQDRSGVLVNLTSDSESILSPAATVLLLEPQIDYSLQSFSYDPVTLPVEKSRIRDTLNAGLSKGLSTRGLLIMGGSDSALQPGQRFLLHRLMDNYQQLMALRNFSDDPLPSLGPMVNRLSSPAESDFLLISRYTGMQKSQGQQRKDSITASMRALVSLGTKKYRVTPARHGELEVVLIDGVSGQVIWSGFTSGQPSLLDGMIERVLETLPTKAL